MSQRQLSIKRSLDEVLKMSTKELAKVVIENSTNEFDFWLLTGILTSKLRRENLVYAREIFRAAQKFDAVTIESLLKHYING